MVINMYINGVFYDKVKLITRQYNQYVIKLRVASLNRGHEEWITIFNGQPKSDGIKITLQLMSLLNQDELLMEELGD